MAVYNNLPVYKTTYDLLLQLFKVCQNMERDYKFTVGENIKKEVIELIMNVYRANSRRDKSALLASARENAEVVRLLLRLLQDMKQVKLETFVDINVKLESVSRQLAAWANSINTASVVSGGESREGEFPFSESACSFAGAVFLYPCRSALGKKGREKRPPKTGVKTTAFTLTFVFFARRRLPQQQ